MLRRNVPSFVTIPLLLGVLVGVLFLASGIKDYLRGPDAVLSTIYRPKPVPVKIEDTKYITKYETKIKRERVEIPVEVIKEVPAPVEKKLEDEFHITLPALEAEHKKLAAVKEIPKAPYGGDVAITVNTDSGKVEGIFTPKRAPLFELGGIREASLGYDPINAAARLQYRQDLARVGPVVINVEAHGDLPVAGFSVAKKQQGVLVGASINAAVRF